MLIRNILRSIGFFLIIFNSILVFGQKQANIWYLGDYNGLDFNTKPPKIFKYKSSLPDNISASICDKNTGELLFYTDGKRVWNRFDELMPHSNQINTETGGLQSPIIVPIPKMDHQYYIFSLSYNPNTFYYPIKLAYSIVDISLENGKGDLVENVILKDSIADRLTAIPHVNGQDYWLVTHLQRSTSYLVYPITPSGIGIPLIQPFDDSFTLDNIDDSGYLKASPGGNKLTCSVYQAGVDLFDFDASTGIISNHLNLERSRGQGDGISFSPDNSKLYISTQSNQSDDIIRQYDLNAGDSSAIKASGKSIIMDNPNLDLDLQTVLYTNITGMQLASDGKIYNTLYYDLDPAPDIILTQASFLTINCPNESGFASNVTAGEIRFEPSKINLVTTLPNFMEAYFNGIQCTPSITECRKVKIVIFPNPAYSELKARFTLDCYSAFDADIVNLLGQTILSFKNIKAEQVMKVETLASGAYLLVIRLPSGDIKIEKFIKI